MIGKTDRQEFLEAFLKLYGVVDVEYIEFTTEKVFGTAIYDHSDPEEIQPFCWNMQEENVPPKEVLEIIHVIHENHWCDIDKITVSKNELFEQMGWNDRQLFDTNFDRLFKVTISMIDDGEESDSFLLHT